MGARIPSLELRWPVVPAVHVGHFFAAMAPMSGDTSHYTYPTKVPLVGKAVDALAWNGDRDIDTMLDFYQRQIEA